MRATIEQWRVFRALVDNGTYAAAADALDKSVSSVHSAVHKLQNSLGVELFEVAGRRATLTNAGNRLLHRADVLLEQARLLELLAVNLAQGEEATVRVAIETIYPRTRLHQVLARIGSDFPHLRIEMHETVIHGAADLLENGEVDIAVTPIVPKLGTFQTLGRIRFTPVAHPEHALHQLNRALLLDDLRGARHIVVRDSAPHLARQSAWLQAPDYWTVGTMDLSIELICAGLGFAWLPVSRIQKALDNGLLKPLPMAKLNDRHVELFLAHLDSSITGPVCGRLLEELAVNCS